MGERCPLVIVGGGQAGLAASYWAQQSGLDHVVLDGAASTGQAWRERYDHLQLFTPRRFSHLPGLPLAGAPDGYPTKDEIADYLAAYAEHFSLPVRQGAAVEEVRSDGLFVTRTAQAEVTSDALIVATGPFQAPRVPAWADQLPPAVQQVHSSHYRNPTQIPGPRVLVVGGGNSGAQIGEDLVKAGREVTWSSNGRPRFIPHRMLGRSIFWWTDAIGALDAGLDTWRARVAHWRGAAIFGREMVRLISADRVRLVSKATGTRQGEILFGDDGAEAFDAVIWCTGYRNDYSWLDVPGALNARGAPDHREGIARGVPHLGFVGLEWQRTPSSARLGGVGEDARVVVEAVTSA